MSIILNRQQRATISLIKSDLRYIYTILKKSEFINSNYITMMSPILGTIIDGAEDWLKAYNNSHKDKLDVPLFTAEEQSFYAALRSSIKMMDTSYSEFRDVLAQKYAGSDAYFSSLCKPLARVMKLYDIYGADISNSHYCGNTILCSCYIPQFHFGTNDGETLKRLSIIAGKYISVFGATEEYPIDKTMQFSTADYGGFINSPVGNRFSDKFVLFTILCQINFIIISVDKYIQEECPTKLRFAYLQYFYTAKIIDELNQAVGVHLIVDKTYLNKDFRNAMAHYKIGVALKENEIIDNDLFFGLTQKYFNCSYMELKKNIFYELNELASQLSSYLGFR